MYVWNREFNYVFPIDKYMAFSDRKEHETVIDFDLTEKAENIDFIRLCFPYYGMCQKGSMETLKTGYPTHFNSSIAVNIGLEYN